MGDKRNNSSWVCDRLEELIEEWENRCEDTYDTTEYLTYCKVIEEIQSILYE